MDQALNVTDMGRQVDAYEKHEVYWLAVYLALDQEMYNESIKQACLKLGLSAEQESVLRATARLMPHYGYTSYDMESRELMRQIIERELEVNDHED